MAHRVPLEVFGSSDRALVTVGDREIALFRVGDRVHAFENACPHEGNPLIDGDLHGETLRCVYHLWEFDLKTGACLYGEEPAKTYQATIQGDEIHLDI